MRLLRKYKVVLVTVVFLIVIRTFFIDNYVITSNSMRGSLQIGEYVLVSKLSYGPRLPMSLKVPFINYENPFFNIFDFKPFIGIHNSNIRMFHSLIERNDVIAFDPPNRLPQSSSLYVPFIKRCVAIPGDTLEITNGKLYVNRTESMISYKKDYILILKQKNDLKLIPFPVIIFNASENLVKANLDRDQILTLESSIDGIVIKEVLESNQFNDLDIFPYSLEYTSNIDNIPPVVIPFEGMQVPLNSSTYVLYKEAINLYEGVELKLKNDSFTIDGVPSKSYVFKQNYYWAIGDNWDYSIDSRYWGFFPEKYIIGKALTKWITKWETIN